MPPAAIALPTLTVVQGAALMRTLQGKNLDGTVPTQFQASDTLTGSVWVGQAEPAALSFSPTWVDASTCEFQVALSNTDVASLAIDTTYNLQVFATRSGTTYCIGWVWLQVLPAAGVQVAASPPDLVTFAFASQLLASLGLSQAQMEMVPTLVSVASDVVRKFCARLFSQGTYIETLPVQLDGTVRLSQCPINWIQRVQAIPIEALFVGNPLATLAWIYPTVSGAVSVYTPQTMTGLVLNWETGGTLQSQTIAFSTGMTIGGLAAAINAVQNGWQANAHAEYAQLPVAEIIDGIASKGAAPADEPIGGAAYHVYSINVPNARFVDDDGQLTGVVYVGRIRTGDNLRWGPEAGYWESQDRMTGKARITYNAGFPSIPYEVQLATVELVKAQLDRLKTEMLLSSEHGGDYSYAINTAQAIAIPPNVRAALSKWRIWNA